MTNQFTAILLTLAAQTLLAHLSAANPIPNPGAAGQKRTLGVNGGFGTLGYPYGSIGACAAPYVVNYDTACNNADQRCQNVAYKNCEHVACNVCKDCDTAYCANNDVCSKDNKLNCFNVINKKAKRSGGYPYSYGAYAPYDGYGYGIGYPYGNDGCGTCGSCDPCVVSSKTACNSADQCCNNVAYKNCEHEACNICKDCDTAYCTNSDACSKDNKFNCFNTVNKKVKRSGGYGASYYGYGAGYPFGYGAGYPNGYGAGYPYGCDSPCMVSSKTACNNADKCCNNVAYENCEHEACNICKDCDTAYCANNDACSKDNKINCFNAVNRKVKRGGVYPYSYGAWAPYDGYGCGAGYGYGAGYDACGACGSCAPCVVNSNTACNKANQCCDNVAYENCKHVAANICKDCDTAYCTNKDTCCDNSAAKNLFNVV